MLVYKFWVITFEVNIVLEFNKNIHNHKMTSLKQPRHRFYNLLLYQLLQNINKYIFRKKYSFMSIFKINVNLIYCTLNTTAN